MRNNHNKHRANRNALRMRSNSAPVPRSRTSKIGIFFLAFALTMLGVIAVIFMLSLLINWGNDSRVRRIQSMQDQMISRQAPVPPETQAALVRLASEEAHQENSSAMPLNASSAAGSTSASAAPSFNGGPIPFTALPDPKSVPVTSTAAPVSPTELVTLPANQPAIPSLNSLLPSNQNIAPDPVMQRLSHYGTPITKQALSVGGLTQWTVISKTGKPVKLYTTADGQALIAGVVWNLASGLNLSDAPALAPQGLSPQGNAPVSALANASPNDRLLSGRYALAAAFDGKIPVQIPPAIKQVDELAGFKEGKGSPAETLYIIIDPRCPYCRRAYQNTRQYVKNGATIKWIPTVALGQLPQGIPLATTILHASPDVIDRVLGNHEEIPTQAVPADASNLDKNFNFLLQAFKNNNDDHPGVPAAFYFDRRTGQVRMSTGLSEPQVIIDILGNPDIKR